MEAESKAAWELTLEREDGTGFWNTSDTNPLRPKLAGRAARPKSVQCLRDESPISFRELLRKRGMLDGIKAEDEYAAVLEIIARKYGGLPPVGFNVNSVVEVKPQGALDGDPFWLPFPSVPKKRLFGRIEVDEHHTIEDALRLVDTRFRAKADFRRIVDEEPLEHFLNWRLLQQSRKGKDMAGARLDIPGAPPLKAPALAGSLYFSFEPIAQVYGVCSADGTSTSTLCAMSDAESFLVEQIDRAAAALMIDVNDRISGLDAFTRARFSLARIARFLTQLSERTPVAKQDGSRQFLDGYVTPALKAVKDAIIARENGGWAIRSQNKSSSYFLALQSVLHKAGSFERPKDETTNFATTCRILCRNFARDPGRYRDAVNRVSGAYATLLLSFSCSDATVLQVPLQEAVGWLKDHKDSEAIPPEGSFALTNLMACLTHPHLQTADGGDLLPRKLHTLEALVRACFGGIHRKTQKRSGASDPNGPADAVKDEGLFEQLSKGTELAKASAELAKETAARISKSHTGHTIEGFAHRAAKALGVLSAALKAHKFVGNLDTSTFGTIENAKDCIGGILTDVAPLFDERAFSSRFYKALEEAGSGELGAAEIEALAAQARHSGLANVLSIGGKAFTIVDGAFALGHLVHAVGTGNGKEGLVAGIGLAGLILDAECPPLLPIFALISWGVDVFAPERKAAPGAAYVLAEYNAVVNALLAWNGARFVTWRQKDQRLETLLRGKGIAEWNRSISAGSRAGAVSWLAPIDAKATDKLSPDDLTWDCVDPSEIRKLAGSAGYGVSEIEAMFPE